MKNIVLELIFKLLIFTLGILIGILLMVLIFKVIEIISKKKKINIKIVIKKSVKSIDEIRENKKNEYLMYKNHPIKKRIEVAKEMLLSLIIDISKTYNPDSNNPMLEVSYNSLKDLANDVINRVERLINDIINSKYFKVLWATYATVENALGFFSKLIGKNKEVVPTNIRNVKISYIINKIELVKSKQKTSKDSNDSKILLALNNYINDKVLKLFDEVALYASNVYSNNKQYLLERVNGDAKC